VAHTVAVARGCGASRSLGDVYAECGLGRGRNAKPLEFFMVCPPIPIDKDRLGLDEVGVKLIRDNNGIYHIFDIVSQNDYPNVLDFGEEVRRFGLSRKVAVTTNFHLLTRESRFVILHKRGYIENAEEYFAARAEDAEWNCPKVLPQHEDRGLTPPMCASVWWEDITINDKHGGHSLDGRRHVMRKMPSFSYSCSMDARTGMPDGRFKALLRPEGVKPQHRLAICFSFPVTNWAVIRDRGGNEHQRAVEKLSSAGLQWSLDDA
jgi:hypothetical protein